MKKSPIYDPQHARKRSPRIFSIDDDSDLRVIKDTP